MSAVTFQALKERLKAEKANKQNAVKSSDTNTTPTKTEATSTITSNNTNNSPLIQNNPILTTPEKSLPNSNKYLNGSLSSSLSVPITLRSPLTIDDINNQYTIGTIPTVRYIPNICTLSMEQIITDYIDSYDDRWINLRRRRLQQYGGKPTPQGLVDPEPLPLFLNQIIDCLMSYQLFPTQYRPNHVLINEYLPFQGIFPHTDGPSYYPLVATISIGGDVIMRYQPRGSSTSILAEVILQSRSLVVTSEEAYTDYMHSIAEVDTEIIGGTGGKCINLHLLSPKDLSNDTELLSSSTKNNNNTDTSGTEYYQENDLLIRSPRRISLTIRHVPSLETRLQQQQQQQLLLQQNIEEKENTMAI